MKTVRFDWKSRVFALALGLLASTQPGCAGKDEAQPTDRLADPSAAKESFSFEVHATELVGLRLEGYDGKVRINAEEGGQDQVVVSGVRWAEAETLSIAQAALADLDVAKQIDSGVLTLRTARTELAGVVRHGVDYEIAVPEAFAVSVLSEDGGVLVEGPTGAVTVKSSRGDVTVCGATGSVQLDVAEGHVFSLGSLPSGGELRVDLGKGDIWSAVPFDTSAKVVAQAGGGGVTILDLPLENIQGDGSKVSGVLGVGDGLVQLSTQGGDVALQGFTYTSEAR